MNKDIFKIICITIWAVLTIIFGIFCAIPYFCFTPENFEVVEGVITGGIVSILYKHMIDKKDN